jgi:hypothetical protein
MADNNQNEDGSFNEDELQDIMSEIENLEKDFTDEQVATAADVTPEPASEEVVSEDSSASDLQNTIDAEIAELNAITEVSQPEIGTETEAIVEPEQVQEQVQEQIQEQIQDNVVSIVQDTDTNKSSTHESTYSGAPVELSCNGDMDFNMNFSLGESSAKVKVDKETGLSVQMDGVSLTMSKNEGCVISLPGGVKFTVPLTSEGSAATKKAS